MILNEGTKKKLRTAGAGVLIAGIALLLVGSAIQIISYISNEGEVPAQTNNPMMWGGVMAALGIPAIVGGQAMRVLGSWKSRTSEDEPEERPRETAQKS